jgi:DNA-binding CsgD family transcriptional regulator
VLEDLHWADHLSLEVIGRAAARLADHRMLVVGTYRSDELYPRTAMREWRARLLSQRLAEEIRLQRLTVTQTATMASTLLGRAAPARLVAGIHDRSDGIPLHIEELLAAVTTATIGATGGGDPGYEVHELRVPDTLADAILQRARTLPDSVRDIAAAAAVIGRSFDFDLLAAVAQVPGADVDGSLRELQDAYLVQAGADATTFDFRHALIRDALYDEIPLPRRRVLHQRVAACAVDRGYRDAFVSVHFDLAGMAGPAYAHALRAADDASTVSAHRDALSLYRRALRNLPADLGPDAHAALLVHVGEEAAAVDDNVAADLAYQQAYTIWIEAADILAAAAVVPPMVAVRHLLGDGLDVRVGRLLDALAAMENLPTATPVRIRLLSALAAAYVLDRRLEQAIEYGEQSRALSHAGGDEHSDLDTAATLGSVLAFAGDLSSGWDLLETAVDRATASHDEVEAARSYRMLGTSASALVEYERADLWLNRGIAYSASVELWNHHSYMTSHLAHVHWATGRWDEATESAGHALADGRGGVTTRITAEYVLGYVALGRGDWATATELLDEALGLGTAMGELQRISPPLWGLAETAWLQGDHDRAVALCNRGYDASDEVADAAYLFPFLVTGARARLAQGDVDGADAWLERVEPILRRRNIPGTMPAIEHARGLVQLARGQTRAGSASLGAAQTDWAERGRFWEGTWALLDRARFEIGAGRRDDARSLAQQARTVAQQANAGILVAAADELLDRVGAARASQPWHPLTAREYSVATLVAAGLTNREIAGRLVVSPKTVSAHVEHILGKLGAARRAEIAAWAARIAT